MKTGIFDFLKNIILTDIFRKLIQSKIISDFYFYRIPLNYHFWKFRLKIIREKNYFTFYFQKSRLVSYQI